MTDEVVAVVDLTKPRIILLSDLIVLEAARARQGDIGALRQAVDGQTLADTLEELIGQLVVLHEADILQLPEPAKTEVDQGIAAIRRAIGPAVYDPFSAEYDLDDDVEDFVRREIRVSRYLDNRFRLASRPKDVDVEAYVTAHEEYNGRDPVAAAAAAREKLTAERFARLSASFIADVRRRARVRILHDPSIPLVRRRWRARFRSQVPRLQSEGTLSEPRIRVMEPSDLDAVMRIEQAAHTHPWSAELMRA